jgi:hypothetical protein
MMELSNYWTMINVSKSAVDERKFSNADDCHYLEFLRSWETRSDRQGYKPESQGRRKHFVQVLHFDLISNSRRREISLLL